MDMYLVFKLQKWVKVNVAEAPVGSDGVVQAVWIEPVYEDRLYPCFELVKEFELFEESGDWQKDMVDKWASQYSLDNKVRCVVVKGTVFGD
jgi:hypothetical protein